MQITGLSLSETEISAAKSLGVSQVRGSMLLVLPVAYRRRGNQLLFESQACNGLNRCGRQFFQRCVVAAPVMPGGCR